MDKALLSAAQKIRLVVLDVDGVLTDGSIWTGPDGEFVKRFYTRDGLGIVLLQKAGIPVAILTGRISKQTAMRAAELGIKAVRQGKTFKGDDFLAIAKEFGVALEEVAYMGDDVPDMAPLKLAGLPACPADADPSVLPLAKFVSPAPGGQGAVRSLAELILRAQGKWEELINRYYLNKASKTCI